ncbi:MAG: DUF1631 family protein [Rhodanobacter sp.]
MDVGQDRPRQLPPQAAGRALSVRWPPRAQNLLETSLALCIDQLHAPLRACLAQFAQKLFDMAESSHIYREQQKLFTLRERVLVDQGTVEEGFVAQLTRSFDHVDASSARAADDAGATWHQLKLLDPVEQELATTLDQLGTRGDSRHGSVLYELGYRMAVLIGSPPLEGEALPLGPHALAQAFHRASMPLELPLEHQVQLLRGFDRAVIQSLADLYVTINAHLLGDGILPQLRSISLPRHLLRPPTAAAEAEAPRHNESAPSEPIEVLESLRNLLARRRAGSAAHAPHGTGERAASTDELQTALGALQQHLGQVTDRASRELRSAARLREELLAQLNVGTRPGMPQTQLSGEQSDSVELVAMLFEQLGKQLQGGGGANALLGNLQLPVLRMAVADHEFFDQPQHPARQLLDTVTTAANEWLDGSDDDATRLLASKLERLIARASEEPPSNGLYAMLLADIEHHLALLSRKAKVAERRHIEAAQGRERLDAARARAGELMAERFAQSAPRGLLRALLDRAWSDVLALTLLRHGEESDVFGQQLAITDQLLGRLPMGDRARLQQDVEAGLQQIGMHTEEAIQVAQRLLGVAPAEGEVEQLSTTDLALRLKQHQRLGETAGAEPTPAPVAAPAEPPDPHVERVLKHLQQLPFGTWFEFPDGAGGTATRRKLAWYSPMSGRCLLVTRRGQRSEESTLLQLAQELADGRAQEAPPQSGSLLDRAWRSLSGVLRQSSSSATAESHR